MWLTSPYSDYKTRLHCSSQQTEDHAVPGERTGGLTFETLLTDPLIRLVMESDGVSVAEMTAVLEAARAALTRSEEAEAAEAC
jgi:hypothetical protein